MIPEHDDPERSTTVADLPGGALLVQAVGVVGVATSAALRRVHRDLRPDRPRLVVDLGDADVVHRHTWRTLRLLLVEIHRRGGTTLVVLPDDPLAILALIGVPFDVHPDLDAALAALPKADPGPNPGPNPRPDPTIVRRRPRR